MTNITFINPNFLYNQITTPNIIILIFFYII